jgi:hypothetical protein
MHSSLRKWLLVSLFNLMLVAFIGIILRYKIAFSLPFIDQKYLLHAHSHFAFAGWITQALMALLVATLSAQNKKDYFIKYRWIIYANLITAYGMLFTFPFIGYGFLSILFSTLSVFVFYVFAIIYWRDLNKTKDKTIEHGWFKLALLCGVISSAGPFSLAYMMAVKSIVQNWYLVSIYFFLHFQYNGWFFFGCMGLLARQLSKNNIPFSALRKIYLLFAIAVLPTLFLSLLWWPLPIWLYVITVIGAICQLAGLRSLINSIRLHKGVLTKNLSRLQIALFALTALALTIKLCLQAFSVIPSVSKLAFGFRPIVIGYLHLVLLGVISIFILAYVSVLNYLITTKVSKTGIVIFVAGILLNESLLSIQGVADLGYKRIPFIDRMLLTAAAIMFVGIFLINYGVKSKIAVWWPRPRP